MAAYQPNLQFSCFPRLPPEIQLMIWKFTLEPNVIEIRYEEDPDSGNPNYFDYDKASLCETGFWTNSQLPVVLKVCRDSLNAVLPYYPECFGSIWFPGRIRFNMSLDTLYLGPDVEKTIPLLFSMLSEREKPDLRYLAFDLRLVDNCDEVSLYSRGYKKGLNKAMDSLKGLEELLLTHDITSSKNDDLEMDGGHWVIDESSSSQIELHRTIP